jgi:mono/diheme cytochrome c family protein
MKRRKTSSGCYGDLTALVGMTALVLTGLGGRDANASWPLLGPSFKEGVRMRHFLKVRLDLVCAGLVALVVAAAGIAEAQQLPLLGPSMHGGSFAQSFCEGRDGKSPKPDSAAVPLDPRARITKGSPNHQNATRAVYFNGAFLDCHVGMPVEEQPLGYKTCGEFRARVAKAEAFIVSQMLGSPVTAESYDSAWQSWGMSKRPANYEALLALETAGTVAAYHNPYPIAGEDPNAPGMNGGSGQLPVDMRQLKDADGKWTGMVAPQLSSCSGCHTAQVGNYGEPGAVGTWGSGANQGGLGGQRGQVDAHTPFEALYFVVGDWDTETLNPLPGKYLGDKPTPREDTPSWWNVGHRPRKVYDGGESAMSIRIDLSGAAVGNLVAGNFTEWVEKYDQDMQLIAETTKSPPWPEVVSPINTALAEQGAVLFHTKNLFAGANAERPKPDGGNGSCASCHGAYSPRYVNDPKYLESPDFEGIADHIVKPEVLGTDRVRLDAANIEFTDVWDTSWWAYPDHQPGYIRPEDKTPAQEAADDNKLLIPFTDPRIPSGVPPLTDTLRQTTGLRTIGACDWGPPNGVPYVGYQAPPLYGIWASAPYFHNGSVPTVEAVLDSTQRLLIWQRKQVTTPTGTKAFDYSFATGYDFAGMGWKVDEIPCETFGNDPLYSCNPIDRKAAPTTREAINLFENNSMGGLATSIALGEDPFMQLSQVPGQETTADIETRLIHDTRIHGNSNTGHEFSDILTAPERKALIEYLKTL